MIQISISDKEYASDIRNLVKAFYQNQDIVLMSNDGNVSNTQKRKLAGDKVIGRIIFSISPENVLAEFKSNDVNDKLQVNIDNKEDTRKGVNKAVYKALTKHTGKELPWGMMTGVHPAKPVLKLMEQEKDTEFMKEKFQSRYLCNDQKRDLIFDIAGIERKVLQRTDYKNSYSLYIGIPFCPTTCVYCSFTSYSLEKYAYLVEAYLEALFKEIDYTKDIIKSKKLVTVYIGGGTPTSLNADQLDRLLKKICSSFNMSDVTEFTVEAGRPDSITYDKLKVMKDYNVTRISINPQSMNQKTLDVIGRKHSVSDIIDTYEMARRAGHDNINMDLIMGLMGENVEMTDYTLREIIKLRPENVTVHTLALKRASSLNINMNRYKDMLGYDVAAMVNNAYEVLSGAGYMPYYLYRQKNMADNLENTGYCLPNRECIYNIYIMEEVQTILALGAGGVSKFLYYNEGDRLERVDNVKSLKDYIERIQDMINKKKEYVQRRREISDEIF